MKAKDLNKDVNFVQFQDMAQTPLEDRSYEQVQKVSIQNSSSENTIKIMQKSKPENSKIVLAVKD